MDILEYFLDLNPGNDIFYPRKLRLPSADSFLLYGARSTGKTALILEYLGQLKDRKWLGFDRSHSPTLAFNRFLKLGTLPALGRSTPASAVLRLRELFYEMFDDAESRLLLILARFQGRRVTTHQIYTTAREYFRISKDWTYATLKRFEEEKLLFFVPDIQRGSGNGRPGTDQTLASLSGRRSPGISAAGAQRVDLSLAL